MICTSCSESFFSLTQICRVNFSMRLLNFLVTPHFSFCQRQLCSTLVRTSWTVSEGVCFLFRRSYSDLCRNRELFLSAWLFPKLPFSRLRRTWPVGIQDRAGHSQRARTTSPPGAPTPGMGRTPKILARDAVHPGLLHYPRALLL